MTLSDRLQRLLRKQGLTAYAVAELAGMTKQQAWAVVTGRIADPRVSTVQRIVEAAGGTMAELFADEE